MISALVRLNAARARSRFGLVLGIVVLALLMLEGSAWAAGEYEPNDSRDTAFGPLAGGTWYEAGFETTNDVDWFKFYIKTYSQMDFSAGMVKDESCCENDRAYLELFDKDGKRVDNLYSGHLNEVNHLYLTLPAGRYYIEVQPDEGYPGDRYKIRIDPASSITTDVECGEAIVARESVVPLLAEAQKELEKSIAKLAPKVEAVHEAKKELRHASKKAKRLKQKMKYLRKHHPRGRRHFRWSRKVGRIRAKLRGVRSEVRSAVTKVNDAKEARKPIWEERTGLEAATGQRQQEINDAEGKIAAHC